MAGGYNDGFGSLDSVVIYDPTSGTWSSGAIMAMERSRLKATRLPGGRVLVVGGYNDDFFEDLASAEIYDPGSGTWSAAGDMATPRSGFSATLTRFGVLVAGGANSGTYLASAEIGN